MKAIHRAMKKDSFDDIRSDTEEDSSTDHEPQKKDKWCYGYAQTWDLDTYYLFYEEYDISNELLQSFI